MSEKPTVFCSFCAKEQRQVQRIVAGDGVAICDECVDLCATICAEGRKERRDLRQLMEIRERGT